MSSSSSSSSGGIGVLGLLGVVFVTLKLTDWSWWWVTAPFWGVFALIFGGLFVVIAGWIAIILSSEAMKNRRRSKRIFDNNKRKKITFGK